MLKLGEMVTIFGAAVKVKKSILKNKFKAAKECTGISDMPPVNQFLIKDSKRTIESCLVCEMFLQHCEKLVAESIPELRPAIFFIVLVGTDPIFPYKEDTE